MIETAMLVALGFFAATVLALLTMPLISHRAARLTAERLEALVPLSADEIAAERDGLRAASAVEQRRLEQKLERATMAAASKEAELGRRTAAIIELERAREVDRSERVVLEGELARIKDELAATQTRRTELEGHVADLDKRLRAEEEERRSVQLRREEAEALAEERRGTIASMETRCSGLEMRVADRDEEIERGKQQLARLRATLNETARDRDLVRNELLLASTQRSMLQDDLKGLTRRADDLRARLQAKSEALVTTERRLMEETAQRKAADFTLVDLRRRFETLEARLIEAGGQAAQTLVDTELDALRASVSGVADEALVTLADLPEPNVKFDGEAQEPASVQ